MSAPEVNKPLFFGYPAPKEVVGIELKYPENKNPVLRGVPLVVGAWMWAVIFQVIFSYKLI